MLKAVSKHSVLKKLSQSAPKWQNQFAIGLHWQELWFCNKTPLGLYWIFCFLLEALRDRSLHNESLISLSRL